MSVRHPVPYIFKSLRLPYLSLMIAVKKNAAAVLFASCEAVLLNSLGNENPKSLLFYLSEPQSRELKIMTLHPSVNVAKH